MTCPVQTHRWNVHSLTPDSWEAALARAQQQGFLVVRGLLSESRLSPLAEYAFRQLEAQGLAQWTNDGWKARHDCPAPSASDALAQLRQSVHAHADFGALVREAAVQRVLGDLLGNGAIESAGDILRLALPGTGQEAAVAHQESFYVTGGGTLWVAWIPLAECPLTVGPLAVVPGSHRAGLRAHGGEHGEAGIALTPHTRWESSALERGDVVFFHGHTIHRALPNHTERSIRLSIDYRFRLGSTGQPNS